jgi:hypothetical protein
MGRLSIAWSVVRSQARHIGKLDDGYYYANSGVITLTSRDVSNVARLN